MSRGRIRLAIAAVMLAAACGAPVESKKPVQSVPSSTPTPSPSQPVKSVRGVASWYDATRNNAWYTRETKWGPAIEYYAAAGPAVRELIGDDNPYHEHYAVDVTNRLNGWRIRVIIVDWCSCSSGHPGEKAIDLSPAAFKALGLSLGRGIAPVTITLLP